MISVNLSNIRSAEVSEAAGSSFVTLRFGNNDRAVLHTQSLTQARAIALAVNGAVDAALAGEAVRRG